MSSIALTGKVGLGFREMEETNIGATTSHMVKFQKALKKDDIHQVMALLSKFLDTETRTVNPLHLACEHGSLRVAMEIGRRWPELATTENEDGDIAMHLVSAKGYVEMVEFLEKLHPGSCLVENKSSMTPFQIAVVHGHSDVIRKLVSLRSEFLGKNGSSSISSQIEIQGMESNSPDRASQEISLILQKSPDDEKSSPEATQDYSRVLNQWPVETRNVLLVVLVMIAAAAFTVTCNLPDVLLNEIYRSGLMLRATTTVDFISGRLPTVVYLMVFNSAGFMTSMALISYLIWPLPLRSILLFVVVSTCIVYFILVGKITPKFWVRVGSFSFSSIYLVWTSVVAFIAFGVTIIKMGKYALQCFRWFLQRYY
ncbi:hypothetical protein Dsin_011611 [Dipteronia sinensis]|uniref:PGG domain-containing protein n=1 Tax=Dipteronia sinensis TaxID=43782 RepID=A0AAE0E789_9ROSI|nr:hypothetical protein Dsin_011611 [Dipteronia sinensis]